MSRSSFELFFWDVGYESFIEKQHFVLQYNVLIFFNPLWFVLTAPISDTQNPEILGFQLQYKIQRQAKMKRREYKMRFLLASHQSTYVPEKHIFAYRPLTSEEN